MTEALLPVYQDYYVPQETNYTKEDVVFSSDFYKGRYASSMKVPRIKGNEFPGEPPAFFESSSIEDKYKGWFSASSDGYGSSNNPNFMELPYFVLDDNTEDEEELIVDEFGDYLILGESGSSNLPTQNNLLKRDGKPGKFEIRTFERFDQESLIHNKLETIQGLYVENTVSTETINLSGSFWPYEGLDAPDDINWELKDNGRGYYCRFGTRGKFEFVRGDEYVLEFSMKKLTSNNRNLVTVHLLEHISDPIDDKGDMSWPWNSQLIGNSYATTTFRKRFTANMDGYFKIVFVVHGGTDESNNPHKVFKFFLTDFKLSHMEKADYNPSSKYSTAMKNLFYRGCKQTDTTTPDGLPAVEWTDSNPNILVVDPSGETELDVF